jgi:UDP-N-acetylglucosamine--N-acetylmuramyl-(pentapeptide) pyrophosphoryl-undecaprenol N-acetylglucosamine transferase
MKSVPYFLQEQNAVAGLTVKFFAPAAKALYLGFPEATATLPDSARARVVVTGNPIAPPPLPQPDRADARARWGFSASVRHVLLVFGGSQGSRAINDAVSAWLPTELPAEWGAIWITGRSEHARLAHYASDRIRIVEYQQPMADAYAAADVAVARAGAMSTAELCAWGIPMVLIPLPSAAADHQTQNAEALARASAARLVLQSSLSGGALRHTLGELCTQPAVLASMSHAARARARVDASQMIARHILKTLNLQ